MHKLSYSDDKRVKDCESRLVTVVKRQIKDASPGYGLRLQYFDTLLSTVEKNPSVARASDWVATLGGKHTG
eukprot:4089287-Prorocentrum_lima.AAC.1